MTILSVITLSSFDSKLNYNNNKGTQEAGSERKLSVFGIGFRQNLGFGIGRHFDVYPYRNFGS
jgi:hypothetical protein